MVCALTGSSKAQNENNGEIHQEDNQTVTYKGGDESESYPEVNEEVTDNESSEADSQSLP